ncbi:MAG: glycine--tRNA ligase subunit beta [Nitrospinae bacterium]|nr:glycine--tRNA ligase subunit beta [Nitrospinota bacterium]
MSEFLYEIGVEELPAGYVRPAVEALKTAVLAHLEGLGIPYGDAQTYATPRRLAISIKDIPDRRPQRLVKQYGPPAKAAFDSGGSLTKAGYGFAKSKGVEPESIRVENTGKGEYIYVEVEEGGEKVAGSLASALPKITLGLPFPKSMVWGAGEARFARPIRWIVMLFDGQVVPMEVAGIWSGPSTRGHRFLGDQEIQVSGREDYLRKLKENHVLADSDERREAIVANATAQAALHGAQLVGDDELLGVVTFLTEWPVPLWGQFDHEFLALPEELLIASMKAHQKMFAARGLDGKLTNGFIGVSNTHTPDDSVVTAGYRRVLRARLADAKFFLDEDRKKTPDYFNGKLAHVTYQKKLGVMSEKVARVRALSAWLAERVCPSAKSVAERAAELCKFDLATQMVYEFPELQGVMGREYALHSGESAEVCAAIYEHYLPKGMADTLPATQAGAVVAVADKMDTLAGCFGVGLIPTGAQDPFALRRSALGVIQILFHRLQTPVSLKELTFEAARNYGGKLESAPEEVIPKVMEFFSGRLKNLWVSGGIPYDVADAVLAAGFDDLSGANMKAYAMAELKKRDFFEPLAITFKRVANITKGHAIGPVNEKLFEKEVEGRLLAETGAAQSEIAPFTGQRDYLPALERIAALRGVVDTFFDDVLVMAENEDVRRNRLNLLCGVSGLFGEIVDFSKIVSP